jgi:hypothetical protein
VAAADGRNEVEERSVEAEAADDLVEEGVHNDRVRAQAQAHSDDHNATVVVHNVVEVDDVQVKQREGEQEPRALPRQVLREGHHPMPVPVTQTKEIAEAQAGEQRRLGFRLVSADETKEGQSVRGARHTNFLSFASSFFRSH